MTFTIPNLGFLEIVDPTPCFLHFLQYIIYTTFGIERERECYFDVCNTFFQ